MMNIIKSFSKDTIYYGIGNAIKKFITFLLLPLYTRVLTPSDYGILDTLGTGVMILAILFGLNVTDGGSRYYYETEDREEKGIILFTVFIINFLTIIPSAILAFFSSEISVLLFQTDQYNWVVFAACLSIPLTLINDEQSWIYRYKRLPWRYNTYILFRALMNIIMGLILVVFLKKGVLGAQIATIISLSVTIMFSIFTFTRKEYTFKFSTAWAKKIIRFSYPLMLSGLIAWIYTSADRYLLLGYQSTSDVGLYSIGFTLAGPISILNMAIGMSFYPFFMSLYEKEKDSDKPETKKASNQIWHLYLVISLCICSMLSIFGNEIIGFVATPIYKSAALVIPLLVFSGIFRQSIDITSLGMFLKEKTIHYTWLVALTSGISLGLNFLLIPKLSFQGAATSNMLSNFIYLIIAYNLSQKYFFIQRNIKVISFYMIIIFFMSNLVPVMEFNLDIKILFAYKVLIFVFCLVLPFLLKLVNIDKLKTLLSNKSI